MTDMIMRLRKCAEELSRIVDAMAKQMSGSPTIDFEYNRPDPELVTYAETTVPEITRLDMLRCRPQVPVVVGKSGMNRRLKQTITVPAAPSLRGAVKQPRLPTPRSEGAAGTV